jgi:hypothetical protein
LFTIDLRQHTIRLFGRRLLLGLPRSVDDAIREETQDLFQDLAHSQSSPYIAQVIR